jgi:hypothetical protein
MLNDHLIQMPATKLLYLVAKACLGLALVVSAYSNQEESSSAENVESIVLEENVQDQTAADSNTSDKSVPVTIKSIQRIEKKNRSLKEPTSWLGLATEECSEALTAQLGLQDGSGLLVMDVSTNSPACKAGLQRNDVLVEFENQLLVHPSQLRKLVQSRKPGDAVSISYYRGGKKLSATVEISKAPKEVMPAQLDETWSDFIVRKGDPYWKSFQENLPDKEALRQQLDHIKSAIGNIQIDQKKLQQEINRSVQGARQSLEDALSHMTNAEGALEPARRALEELYKSRINIKPNANVTVSTRSKTVHSLVNTDDSGTYVIVAAPEKRLTVHNSEGKLIFEGDIETPDQQAKVPAEVWEKVEPMLDRLPKR